VVKLIEDFEGKSCGRWLNHAGARLFVEGWAILGEKIAITDFTD